MKKQLFIALLATALMVTSVPMTAVAATTTKDAATTTKSAVTTTNVTTTNSAVTTTTSAVTTTNSAITGSGIDVDVKAPEVLAPITLSLDGAYKKMLADSPKAIVAKYTMDSDLSVAKGYSESLSNINRAERKADLKADSWGPDTSNKPMLEANRAFGLKQAPKNYEASLNALKSKTYEMYYNYKYTEAQVQVAKDNLTRTKAIYDSTKLKFKVGTVSKLDTLNAETALNTAKDNYAIAVNGFEQMKMGFNIFMGYNVHQKVTLTDPLTALPFPTKKVDTAIEEALVNRNEVSEAQYNAEMSKFSLDSVKAYPKNSATYLGRKSVVLMADQALEMAPGQIEIDVRTKYMDMKQKHDAITSGKISFENSKEASRLGQLQYDNGFITVNDLSGINLNTFNTQQAYYKAILDYNIAVEAYNLASGVGTDVVTIK